MESVCVGLDSVHDMSPNALSHFLEELNMSDADSKELEGNFKWCRWLF